MSSIKKPEVRHDSENTPLSFLLPEGCYQGYINKTNMANLCSSSLLECCSANTLSSSLFRLSSLFLNSFICLKTMNNSAIITNTGTHYDHSVTVLQQNCQTRQHHLITTAILFHPLITSIKWKTIAFLRFEFWNKIL